MSENQIKTSMLGARVTEQVKNEFSIEAQRQNLTATEYLTLLIENRSVVIGMMNFDGVLVELSPKNKDFLQGYASVNSLSLDDVLVGIIDEFIERKTSLLPQTDSSFSSDTANGSQLTGYQTLANANGGVNGGVNDRYQQNSQKTPPFANTKKVLMDTAFRLMYETRIVELFNNAQSVINYAVENSGMMRPKLSESKMLDILYQGFTPEDTQYLWEEAKGQ